MQSFWLHPRVECRDALQWQWSDALIPGKRIRSVDVRLQHSQPNLQYVWVSVLCTAWLYDCMTYTVYDCCREIWRMLLATNHCTHCGGYAVVVAHTGDSSQILCGDNSPLMHTGMECTNQLGATILAATQNLHIESTTHTGMGCKNLWGATIFSHYKVNFYDKWHIEWL